MTTVTNIRPVAPALPDVAGYVEALTANRVLGWAWAPAKPDSRVMIDLHFDDGIVATAAADLQRADLASNGIGDGRHAFDIEIPLSCRDRTAELRVFARAEGCEAIPIGAPPTANGLSDQVGKVLRGMDMLLNSQRLIHRNLQTALIAPQVTEETTVAATLDRLSNLQARTEKQLTAIEHVIARLDEQLSRLLPENLKTSHGTTPFPLAARWALGMAVVALIVSLIGLVRSLGG